MLNLIRIFPGTRKKRSTASPTKSYARSTSRNPPSATSAACGPPSSAPPSSSAKTTKPSSARLRLFEIPDPLQHGSDDQRQRHRRVIEDFRKLPAFFRRNKLAPRNRFRVRAAAE